MPSERIKGREGKIKRVRALYVKVNKYSSNMMLNVHHTERMKYFDKN
jgi:hypothetical protein